MRRQVTFLWLAAALGLSLLVVVCNLPGPVPASYPTPLASALPRAPGLQAHPAASPAQTVSSPATLASDSATRGWASRTSQTAALLGPGRKIDLRQAPILGQLVRRGKMPILLAGMAMVLVATTVAQPGGEVEGLAFVPRRGPHPSTQKPASRRQPTVARSAPRWLVVADLVADWERVRLVPT